MRVIDPLDWWPDYGEDVRWIGPAETPMGLQGSPYTYASVDELVEWLVNEIAPLTDREEIGERILGDRLYWAGHLSTGAGQWTS